VPFAIGVMVAWVMGYRDPISMTTIGAGAMTYIFFTSFTSTSNAVEAIAKSRIMAPPNSAKPEKIAIGVMVAWVMGYRDPISMTTIGAGAMTYIVGPITGTAIGN
jgi:GH24 family phage-related lysozyme (muramidase)